MVRRGRAETPLVVYGRCRLASSCIAASGGLLYCVHVTCNSGEQRFQRLHPHTEKVLSDQILRNTPRLGFKLIDCPGLTLHKTQHLPIQPSQPQPTANNTYSEGHTAPIATGSASTRHYLGISTNNPASPHSNTMSSPNSARKDSASQREFDRLKEQHSALGGTASGYSHDDDNSEQSAWPDLPERRRSSTSFKETAKKFKPTKAGYRKFQDIVLGIV